MKHLHETAHGVAGTHMDGSERFECTSCGRTLTREESEGRGLEYKVDIHP